MDFSYSEEQREILALANKIFQEQCTPDKQRALESDPDADKIDRDLWRLVGEAGLLGTALSPKFGGMGFSYQELSLIFEEAGKTLPKIPLLPHTLAALTLEYADGNTHQALLREAASGAIVLGAALAEHASQDQLSPTTTAELCDGQWQITGSKLCVPFATFTDKLLVSATIPGGASLFLVDSNAKGLHHESLRVSTPEPSFALTLDHVSADLIGGTDILRFLVERYTVALCSYQVGCIEAMTSMTASYVAEREQFNVKIGTFQAVGHRAANCYIDVACLRLVTQQAVTLLNSGKDSETAVLVAKSWAGDTGHRVSYAAQHLHGGLGVDRDYPLWRYATYCKHNEINLGTSGYLLSVLGKRIAEGAFSIE